MKIHSHHRPFHGLVAASYTPLSEDGSINTAVIPDYARLLASNGVKSVFICGTTGEGMSLTMEDRMAVAEKWMESQNEDFRVIVHVGHNSMEVSRRLARHAASIGAAAISCIAPMFFKPAKLEHLIEWCVRVAEAGEPAPFYFYHVPVLTGVEMPMVDFLVQGSNRIPTLAGIKYTHNNLDEFSECLRLDNGRFDIPFGWDELLIEALNAGAKGAIGSSYNFSAPLYLEIMRAYHANEHELARSLQQRAIRMIELCAGSGAGYLPTAKTLMKSFGVDCGPVLPPLVTPSPEQMQKVQQNLTASGFWEYACAGLSTQKIVQV